MHGHLDSQAEYREVGGELVSGTIVDSRTTHVEVLARRATGPISWRFRQPRLALFWFRNGLKELHLELETAAFTRQSNREQTLRCSQP
jgi:AraC family transcriptional regulator